MALLRSGHLRKALKDGMELVRLRKRGKWSRLRKAGHMLRALRQGIDRTKARRVGPCSN
jgi:hypothetical protein